MLIEQKQQRQFWVILLIVFLGFIGISIPYLIFPALFLNPHYLIVPADWTEASRAIFLGITLAAYPLGQFIGSPILGSLSDDYGRKRLIASTLVVAAFCNLVTGYAIEWQHLSLLIGSRFVAGVMEGNIAIARAMAVDLNTLSKHKTFGKINAMASIAFLLGPLLGGLLTNKDFYAGLNISTPFHFICILFFCLAALSILVLEDAKTASLVKVRSFWERINLFKRMKVLFINKRLQFLILVSTCFTLGVDVFYEFGPVYLTIKWTLGPSQLIYFNGALCVALAIGNGWLPSLTSNHLSNRTTIIYSIAAFTLFLVGIIFTNSPPMMLFLFALCGFVIGLAVTLLTVKISNSIADEIQGEVMGVQVALRVLGDATICLFGGVLLLISPQFILTLAVFMSLGTWIYCIRKL